MRQHGPKPVQLRSQIGIPQGTVNGQAVRYRHPFDRLTLGGRLRCGSGTYTGLYRATYSRPETMPRASNVPTCIAEHDTAQP